MGFYTQFFVSLCHDMPPLTDVNNYSMIECESVPAKYVISVENVENQLSRLNTKKATGPDNIPTWVLRDFCQVLAGLVACLWNSSIREGKISNVWKSAYVTPLPKVTPALEVRKDLRPISLTPLLSKVLSHMLSSGFGKSFLTKLTLNNLDRWRALLLFTHWWSFYITVTTLQTHLEILFGSFCLIIQRRLTWLIIKLFSKNCLIWEPQHSCFVGLRPS